MNGYLQYKKKSGKVILFNPIYMSEKFIPQIKEANDVSEIHKKLNERKISQENRASFLNDIIGSGKQGKIVSNNDGKNNDIWIRKQKGNILKGVDAMKENATVNVLKAEYKIDEKDWKPKLYYYCEVKNAATMNGGSKGTDTGWIYAGYVHMDIPTPTVPDFTPISPRMPEEFGTLPQKFRRPIEVEEVKPAKKIVPEATETEIRPKPVWKFESKPYFSKGDKDEVNVDVDADKIDKWAVEFNDISEVKANVLKNLRDIDKNNTLQPLFETFSKKANTYPLLWSILLAETQIHGSDNNGMMTNFGRWLQRDPVYKSWVETRIQNLQTEYQSLLNELISSIESKNPVAIKTALEKLNKHLSPEVNQNLMDNLANGVSDAKWLDELKHGNWLWDEALSEGQMTDWYKKFEQGDTAGVYQFVSDKLEARDVLTGTLMQSTKPVFNDGASFESIVEMGTAKITDEAINKLLWTTFEFMWETITMPGSVGRGFLWTGTFKDSYADSIKRMLGKTHEQGLSHEDTIKYIEQMFMAEVVLQKEDEIIKKLSEKAKSGKPEDAQKLALAEQFFKNKSLLTELGDNWKMYMLKTAVVYGTLALGTASAGLLAEGLALRGATTGLGRLGLAVQNGPIASRIYQLWTIQTSLAVGTAISQGDIGALWNLASPKYWLEGTVLLAAFGGLQTGLNAIGVRVSEWLIASRAFTLPRDIIAGMGVMGVNEAVFDGEFTLEEVVNTILFAAAANMTAPKISKGPKGKIKIEQKSKSENPQEILRLENGEPVLRLTNGEEGSYLKLMENSRHPEVVKAKLEKTLQGWDKPTLEKYIKIVEGNIKRLEGMKNTTPEQKTKDSWEIQRHQEKLDIAQKILLEKSSHINGLRETLIKSNAESVQKYEKNVKDDIALQEKILKWKDSTPEQKANAEKELAKLYEELQIVQEVKAQQIKAENTRIEEIKRTTKPNIDTRGNTIQKSWLIDGVLHVEVTQTGFANDKPQTFSGTCEWNVYTGTLSRNDGRVLKWKFKIGENGNGPNHLDFHRAEEQTQREKSDTTPDKTASDRANKQALDAQRAREMQDRKIVQARLQELASDAKVPFEWTPAEVTALAKKYGIKITSPEPTQNDAARVAEKVIKERRKNDPEYAKEEYWKDLAEIRERKIDIRISLNDEMTRIEWLLKNPWDADVAKLREELRILDEKFTAVDNEIMEISFEQTDRK